MDEKEKQEYLKKYKQAKEKGIRFFPDALFKDAVVSLVVFLILVALAYFVGSPLEEQANPGDASYTPKPEWYFLFLFQLLKYFPGALEVIGVVVIPTLAVIILFLLPFLDRHPRRHFTSRWWVIGVTAFLGAGAILLTVLAIVEAPPPAEAAAGDEVAALYTMNCAGCHGPTIGVPAGTNLHEVIARGEHEGMPAWSADLTNDQIDALVGFILSPVGSDLFDANCRACHEAAEVVEVDPLVLKAMFDQGSNYPAHAEEEVPDWEKVINREQRTSLINFLIAPDGQRLFTLNCSTCHGTAVAYDGEAEELRTLIGEGGLHLEMPPWQEKLEPPEIFTLANYVVDPGSVPEGQELFQQNCSSCHGSLIPMSDTVEVAREVIATGGSHQTMPVWGEILTQEQLEALVQFTMEVSSGASVELGQRLYSQNCAGCHGDFGEGGVNPANPSDIIAPISSAEYLKTRDDFTLRSIVAQGQPNFGMSPFGAAYGGLLDDEEIDSLVSFMRSWEANPPVELPPEIFTGSVILGGSEIFDQLCSQCHGLFGEGIVGPSLQDAEFRASNTSQDIYNTLNTGHAGTTMIAWGEVLTAAQIEELVEFIESLPIAEATETETGPSFANDILPIFEDSCNSCHAGANPDGGWDGTTYEGVMTSGDNAPSVIPGDIENSLLVKKILNTQEEGDPMPPLTTISRRVIQLILDWVEAGALDN